MASRDGLVGWLILGGFVLFVIGLLGVALYESHHKTCHTKFDYTFPEGRPALWKACNGNLTGMRFDDEFIRYESEGY